MFIRANSLCSYFVVRRVLEFDNKRDYLDSLVERASCISVIIWMLFLSEPQYLYIFTG